MMIAVIDKRKFFSAMQRQISLALEDLVKGVRHWRIWYILGISELRQRYRRSTLGPFWITLSADIQVAVMGLLLAYLFSIPIRRCFSSTVGWSNSARSTGCSRRTSGRASGTDSAAAFC
jgi:hypothetical protein